MIGANTPTLLALLRAIAESGRTEKLMIKSIDVEGYFKYERIHVFGNAVSTTVRSNEQIFPHQYLIIQDCLIQIAKEHKIYISLHCGQWLEQLQIGAYPSEQKFYSIGQDGIQNMPHALALGLAKVWELEVKE
jgi:hypothetical protein